MLEIHADGHRPKIVKTYDTDDVLVKGHSTIVQLQSMAVWQNEGHERVVVYYDMDAEFKHILDIAPWESLKSDLHSWTATPSNEKGCVALSVPTPAVPTMPLNDAKRPTLCVLNALGTMGFIAQPDVVVHVPQSLEKKKWMPERLIKRNIIYNVFWTSSIGWLRTQ